MSLRLLSFSLGIILVGYLPNLPSIIFICALVTALVLAFIFLREKISAAVWLLLFAVGFVYGTFAGLQLLNNQLPSELAERDLVVEGQVIDLPQEDDRRQLFSLRVNKAYSAYDPLNIYDYFPRKINISSYGELRVKTGEQWHLRVKLKVPRGFVNPGGFDYQVSLLRRGVGATGYIREGEQHLLVPQPSFSLDVLRYNLREWILKNSNSEQKGILIALLVGDTSLVEKAQWGEMIKTGTNHLIAISGLHLGFFAIVGFFIGNLFGRCMQLVWSRYPSMIYGHLCSISLSLFYSLIAGFNIPTIRTLIMLAAIQLAFLLKRNLGGRDTLFIALALVLLYDPLAAYDMGFWLSFGAVAMLIFCFSGRITVVKSSVAHKIYLNPLYVFIKSQWVMFVGLLIPLALLIHTSALLAPAANFVAIPIITFFVIPCLILAALCHFVVGNGDQFLLHCAERGMSWVHEWLNYLLMLGAGKLNPVITINPLAVILAVLSVLLILLPRGLGNKWFGAVGLLLAFIIPLKNLPALHMLVFDVGQGTAILIRTPNHQLLYDTGPLYTENFDAGSGIIVPYLQSQGLPHLDTVVVSHNDQDHSGGLNGVLAATSVNQLWLGEPEKHHRQINDPTVDNCHSQLPWQWDAVNFRFLTFPISANAKANNHSCVLLIEYQGQKILLTGDIEKEVERDLLEQNKLAPVDILLAPHHGSHTSSTIAFVNQLHPHTVIFSAGYHNQHGHPHEDVQERYAQIGSLPLNTAYTGALEFAWNAEQKQLTQYRQYVHRYWFDSVNNSSK